MKRTESYAGCEARPEGCSGEIRTLRYVGAGGRVAVSIDPGRVNRGVACRGSARRSSVAKVNQSEVNTNGVHCRL